MTQLANDTDLKYASIDLSLYHVNSGILLQLWKGVIQSFSSDGTATFPITCSDGFFQIMNQYPERQISRQCWKTFNDVVTTLGSANPTQNCPFATKGTLDTVDFPSASSTACDYYLESANGCQAHGMSKYFGAQQADPQGTNIKDDSTGFAGFGRNKVTATSIVSDTIWGLALPEIWCNSGGNPLFAFMANGLMVDYRDESGFADSLAIVGAGPLGGYTTSAVVTNADGFRYVVAPMVDGYLWQGLKINGDLNVTQNKPGYGLRQVLGSDPANPAVDFFSLGQGGGQDSNGNPIPEAYEPNNYAAGVATCELRIVKSTTIQPSTPDQHQMVVPIDYGLAGWTWDQFGNRTAVRGLINPFWIAVNMLLRATGLSGNITVPLNTTTITVTLPPSSYWGTSALTIGLFVGVGVAALVIPIVGIALLIAGFIVLIGGAFAGNQFSVPMSNAANQAETILQQNVQNWQNLDAVDQTSANKAIFLANWTTIWNAYVGACTAIFQGNPNSSDAKKALLASIGDREPPGTVLFGGYVSSGKYNWTAYYYTPISTSATPGDSITTPNNSVAQLAMFVLPSLFVGDGSGSAEIAAAQVTPLLGTGTETQFQFQGVVSSQKPFRDWLTEVLNCALGYYTWEFGKLKLGCRINASAVDAYGLGNTLFQTLNLKPIQSTFEHLVLSYADVAYQYQANTAEYCDKDHAAYYGRPGSPLTTQMHSVGCSTLSQALRIAATRTREELGGITYTEWRDARIASWQTTLLGLGNEVGQVVSQTHPEIPGLHGTCNVSGATVTQASGDNWNDSVFTPEAGGPAQSSLLNKDALINGTQVTITAVAISGGSVTSLTVTPAPGNGSGLSFQVITMSFRIQRYTLKKDWSIQIDAQTVTDSMYDLDVGPQPIDVLPSAPPALFYPIPLAPMWAPYQIQAQSWDALFPSEWTFDSDQAYTGLADTSVAASLIITGRLPVTEFSATGAPGPVIGTITQSTTGGSLPANSSLIVSLCAIDTNGLPSAPAAIVVIGTSDTGTDTFTLSNITWPPVSGLASYVLFISLQDDLICAQAAGALTAGGGGTTYTPGSITFGAAIVRSTWALPSPYVAAVRIKAKMLSHSGIMEVAVTSVTSTTVTCVELFDSSGTPPVLVGRALSVIGRNGSSTPFLSVSITGYDHTTGTLTVSPQAVVSMQPMQSFQVGDIVAVRFTADASNTLTPTSISDAGMLNGENSWLGLAVNSERGNILRVIQGTSRGELRKLTGNGASTFSWDLPLYLDYTSVWIIEEPSWLYKSDAPAVANADYQHEAQLEIAAQNFVNTAVLVAGFTVDVNGVESPDGDNPIREDWIYGQAAGVAPGTDTAVPPLPAFTADNSIAGSIRFSAINFAGVTTNLESISQAQFGVYYPSPTGMVESLNAAIGATDTSMVVNCILGPSLTGSFVMIDSEIIGVGAQTARSGFNHTYTITRGQQGSTAAAHTPSGVYITLLLCQTYVYPFPEGFWEPSSGLLTSWQSWAATETLPSTTIVFIDLVFENSFGYSPTAVNNYQGSPLVTSASVIVASTVAVSTTATIAHGTTQVSIDGTTGPFTVTIEPIASLIAPITLVRTDTPITVPLGWIASTAYTLGQTVLDPSGHIQTVTTAGMSGASAPTWNDSGSTTPDGSGSLVWQDGGLFAASPVITITSTGSTIEGTTNLLLDNYILKSATISKP